MGCSQSSPQGSEDDKQRNKDIELQLREDKKRRNQEVKLLLLGAGESGKSTIAKQMKLIYLQGFTKEERMNFVSVIHNNVTESVNNLIDGCKRLGITVNPALKTQVEAIQLAWRETYALTPEIADHVKRLWADPGIQAAYEKRAEFQLSDCAKFFIEEVDRLAAPEYAPTENDILRARAKTTGIIEQEFTIDGSKFLLVDVGGQRSERRKWIHCFQDVTAVLFCVALSEYDQKLQEDETVNRMDESLRLFDETFNNQWFANTSFILFLNKYDLFKEKMKKVDLSVAFPEYTGGLDHKNGVRYLRGRFQDVNKDPAKRKIYAHVTTATNTENVKTVFNACKDIILQQSIQMSGF